MRSIQFLILLAFVVVIFTKVRVLQAQNETSALLEWKASLDNESQSVLISWDRNKPCQSWLGINCSHTPQSEWVVTNISLPGLSLKGSIVALNFSSFRNLEYLDLYNTSLYGSIPSKLANVSQLRFLDLSYNNLSGVIPSEIGMLPFLELLSLYSNRLTGHIPNTIANLTNLIELYLGGNDLTGPIPQEIGMWSAKLESLYFGYNNLTGEIPSSLGNLTHLDSLFIYNNHLSGPIPDSFRNFASLDLFDISSNNLSGSFPKDINFSQISYFYVDDNMLSGSLPRFGKLLHQFTARNNLFSGGILLDIGNSSSLQTLDLSGNQFSGPIPHTIPNLTSLWYLNLDNNMLNGTLPKLPVNIIAYSIKNNAIAGELPSGICSSEEMKVLHLSNNNIGGTLPDCFRSGSKLTSLNLNGNRLQGSVPRSMMNCRLLEVLDLGNNMLKDTFPHWLDDLPQLQVLVLKSNSLHGSVESSSSKHLFPKLRILDLSGNLFTGCFPAKYFENFKAMMDIDEQEQVSTYIGEVEDVYKDSVVLVVKGLEIEYVRILTVLTTIDLSDNKFAREIPSNIKMLNSLRYLNLSHNHLTGQIPAGLDNLTNLESLDLSSNQIKGKILRELSRLTFLVVFNVSSNQLSGAIPQGGQFNTFGNGSYLGNPGLCGFPLPNKCREDVVPTQLQQEEGFFDGFTWESVVLGYGCGIVLGVGLGCLMFSTGKPIWVIKIVTTQKRRKRSCATRRN